MDPNNQYNGQGILSRMSSRASLLQRKSSSMSMLSDPNDLSDLLNQRNLMKPQSDSILNQANREFLENQKQATDAPTKKRLILGSQMFCLSQDGELLLEDSSDSKDAVSAGTSNKAKENDFGKHGSPEQNKSMRRPALLYDDHSSDDSIVHVPFTSYCLSSIGRQHGFSSCDDLPVTEEESTLCSKGPGEEQGASVPNKTLKRSNLSMESIFSGLNLDGCGNANKTVLRKSHSDSEGLAMTSKDKLERPLPDDVEANVGPVVPESSQGKGHIVNIKVGLENDSESALGSHVDDVIVGAATNQEVKFSRTKASEKESYELEEVCFVFIFRNTLNSTPY